MAQNSIVVMVDSLRQDHLGAYSNSVVRGPAMFGVFPGVALAMLLVALNYFSDALRDALDPRRINVG